MIGTTNCVFVAIISLLASVFSPTVFAHVQPIHHVHHDVHSIAANVLGFALLACSVGFLVTMLKRFK